MSKESKLAKKEMKAAKKAAKLEKQQAKQYEKLVKNINKKNAKAEKKAAKKGKPFVPIEIPTQEEAFAANTDNKAKQIVKMVILLLLIAYLIYFLIMWFNYVAPAVAPPEEEGPSAAAVYDRYENQHEITTTPTYSVAEAKELLNQVLHDNWYTIGYKSDPSSGSINNTGKGNVNNSECYMFSAGGKKYAVASNLAAVYIEKNGEYAPLTFHNDELLEFTTDKN